MKVSYFMTDFFDVHFLSDIRIRFFIQNGTGGKVFPKHDRQILFPFAVHIYFLCHRLGKVIRHIDDRFFCLIRHHQEHHIHVIIMAEKICPAVKRKFHTAHIKNNPACRHIQIRFRKRQPVVRLYFFKRNLCRRTQPFRKQHLTVPDKRFYFAAERRITSQ